MRLERQICGCWGSWSGRSSIFETRSRLGTLKAILGLPCVMRSAVWVPWSPHRLVCALGCLTGAHFLVWSRHGHSPPPLDLSLMYLYLFRVVHRNIGPDTRWESLKGRHFWVRDPKSTALFACSPRNPCPTYSTEINKVVEEAEDPGSEQSIDGDHFRQPRASCYRRWHSS